VSELGFMMDKETLQTFIRYFVELKGAVNTGHSELMEDINGVKGEISAVKNDIESSISAVRGNISALETKINAGQEE
jgi:hypothetical protein